MHLAKTLWVNSLLQQLQNLLGVQVPFHFSWFSASRNEVRKVPAGSEQVDVSNACSVVRQQIQKAEIPEDAPE